MNAPFHYVAIPCTDLARAKAFWEAVTGTTLRDNPAAPFPMAYFVGDGERYAGHLFQLASSPPSREGPIVYLQIDPDLNALLARVVDAGGGVLQPKQLIAPGKGYWAVFLDSEGNRFAVHSET